MRSERLEIHRILNKGQCALIYSNLFNTQHKADVLNKYNSYKVGSEESLWTIIGGGNAWVIMKDSAPIGYMAYEPEQCGEKNCIGISIGSNYQRNGYAKEAMECWMEKELSHYSCKIFNALVIKSNLASVKLFRSLGGKEHDLGQTYYSSGEDVIKFTIRADRKSLSPEHRQY